MQKIGETLPTYAVVKIGTDVIAGTSVSPGLVIGLAVWLVIFTGLATVAVRATRELL